MIEFVSEIELEAVTQDIENLISQVASGAGWADMEDAVWRAYVRVEILVTKMKLRMHVENPGVFINPVKREPITEHVPAALASIQKGRDEVSAGRFVNALKSLRECRNELRTFLDSARKARLREARKRTSSRPARSQVSSAPSSPSS